jgi:rhamnosyltransferase
MQSERALAPTVCAVVVAFHPDAEFEPRLHDLLPQVAALVVVDNTPAAARHGSVVLPAAGAARVCLIENAENLGVGAALNQGLAQAAQWNCDWLLTLDQDSRCYPDIVQTLKRVAASCTPPPAVIGGNYLDPRIGRTKVPAAEGGSLEQKTVITSGSLVEVRVAQAVGGFRADYFIDQLDHEFCLRVRSHGGRVVISRKPVMEHSVGEAGGAWLPLLGRLPNHTPLRKYYVARNSVVTIAKYWRTEPDWCLRRATRLILGVPLMVVLERQRFAKVRAFFAGIVDGLRGRMGPCRSTLLVNRGT